MTKIYDNEKNNYYNRNKYNNRNAFYNKVLFDRDRDSDIDD